MGGANEGRGWLGRWRPVGVAGCALALVLGGCATTGWKSSAREPGYVVPSRVHVVVELGPEFDSHADDGGGIASLVEALEVELERRGIRAMVADTKDPNAYPRLSLIIRESDPGNRVLSYALAMGDASVSVSCQLQRARGQKPSFRGEIRAGTIATATTDSNVAAESAGRAIAAAVATTDSP